MRLLLIQSSANPGPSFSRKWSEKVVAHFKAKYSSLEIETLDLRDHPPTAVTPLSVGASFTPKENRDLVQINVLASSEQFVDQFLRADVVVIGAPMYNFGVPATLKAYIDQIVRVGRTFQYTATGPVGLVTSPKKMVFVTSSGGIYSEGPAREFDFLEPYLKALFGFLGLRDFSFIRIEGTAMGAEQIAKAEANAAIQLEALA